MATTMTIRDAKARLSHLLKRAHDGEEIILSFRDAMIVATASQGGATVLLSEDLNPSQVIEGICVKNPFLQ